MTTEEREALIARARETVDPMTRAIISALDEARGQLAALHAAASAVRWGLDPSEVQPDHAPDSSGGGWREVVATLDAALADTAAAAKAHADAVRAPVERERDAWRTDVEAIAAALGCEDGEWVSTELAAIVARTRGERDEARALGLEDAAYLTVSASDAEVFRAQAERLRRRGAVSYPVHGIGAEVPHDAPRGDDAREALVALRDAVVAYDRCHAEWSSGKVTGHEALAAHESKERALATALRIGGSR